jgi:flagellar basal-body rod modification protein FlgD
MQVSNITPSSQTASAAASAVGNSKPTLNYSDFLKLLMAQMQNQDPTSPIDSTQWVSQLATFSSVEQSIQTNAKLDQILQTSKMSDAGALIGRTATSADGSTSGTIVAVTTSSDGMTAELQDGNTLQLNSGITIS